MTCTRACTAARWRTRPPAVARLVAALHGPDGRVAVPGFYDDVRPLGSVGAGDVADGAGHGRGRSVGRDRCAGLGGRGGIHVGGAHLGAADGGSERDRRRLSRRGFEDRAAGAGHGEVVVPVGAGPGSGRHPGEGGAALGGTVAARMCGWRSSQATRASRTWQTRRRSTAWRHGGPWRGPSAASRC